jgi:hypothetical protein
VSTQEPTTEAGKRLHTEAWDWPGDNLTVDGHSSDPASCPACAIIAAIESAARAEGIEQGAAQERERLRAVIDAAEPEISTAGYFEDNVMPILARLLADPEPEGAGDGALSS